MQIINVSQLRVLHSADLHLGRTFQSWGPAGANRHQDILETLEQIGTIARQNRVHLLLLAGDQFDKHNPDPALVNRFQQWLGALGQDGIRVVMISGNHDSYWYEDSVYRQRFPENTTLFQETTCTEPVEIYASGLNVMLYGIAHDHTRQRDVLPGFRRRAEGDVHIGLMHATVDPRADIDVAERYLPLSSANLASTGLDYIALGHLHRARTINPGRPGMAAYPGSPEPLHIRETGPRSVTLITFRGGPPELTTIPCGQRRAERFQIDTTSLTDEEIITRIEQLADDHLILTAELTGAPQEIPDTDALQARAAHHFCYLQVRDATSVVDSGYVRRIENERTIRGEFVRQLRDRIATAETHQEREIAELALQLGLIQLERRSAQ
ncbi:MAG: DNA repair exonuclease [Sphaerobacteraceae bacterium]|nr:MAG: DNA repair exonuclease [Sphaerobacteraceae bacterium]